MIKAKKLAEGAGPPQHLLRTFIFLFVCISKMPPTDWQNHLQNYRQRHPEMSLKDCMTHASKSYRGGGTKKRSEKQKKEKKCEAEVVLDDIIGLSRALCHVATKCDKKELSRLTKCAEKIQEIHDTHFESDEESTENETDCSD